MPVPVAGRFFLVVMAVAGVWDGIMGGILLLPLLRAARWSWAPTAGILLAKSAVLVATLVLALVGPNRSASTPGNLLFFAAFTLFSTVDVFRCREWWGVEPRRGWQTLAREGALVFGVTLALEGAVLLCFAFRLD